jgi:putative DNA primase/helicase
VDYSPKSLLDHALAYAARGWHVFPLIPRTKLPTKKGGFHNATTNPETIRRWFGGSYPHNIGVRTGMVSRIIVLDADGEDGANNLQKLQREHGPLPATLMSQTGRGLHYWFAINRAIANSASKIAPHIDVRGDGGYAVAPPSTHETGVQYRWLNNLPPAPVSDWLAKLASPPKLAPSFSAPIISPTAPSALRCSTTLESSARYGYAALDRELYHLAHAPEGTRNHHLNRSAYCLGQLIAGQELHAHDVRDGLLGATRTNGLLSDDGLQLVSATIESGLNAGLRFPRDRYGRK